MASLPVLLRCAYGTANIQNLTDLSREDTRLALKSLKDQAGRIGLQETIEVGDNEDIDLVFPPDEYYHWGVSSENDQVVRKSRWTPTSPVRLEKYSSSALSAVKDKSGKPELVDQVGNLFQRGTVKMGTPRDHVQPQRDITFSICDFVENPYFTPEVHINFHMISGVDSGLEPKAYRLRERKDQYAKVKQIVIAFKRAGLNVLITCDSNWKGMPGFTGYTLKLVNGSIDKIWFEPSSKANWTMTLAGTGVERIPNPSDHDAFAANVEIRANSNYKVETVTPGKSPLLQLTELVQSIPTGDPSRITIADRAKIISLTQQL